MSEMGSIIQGGGIVLSGAVVLKLLDIGYKAWLARHQRTETEVKPNPLNVHMEEEPEKKFVTKAEFERHVEAVEKRFAAGNEAFRGLRGEIAGMRREMQEGFTKINDRISPVAEACAANSAAIQILLKERHHD